MASEARLSISLGITKGNMTYQSQPSAYQADVAGTKGPTPGAIAVSIFGTDVDLSQLDTPGLCHIRNLDVTNFVEYGIREPGTSTFYPLGEILPGESYVLRLSRNLREEYTNTGTGTSPATNYLHFKANAASVNVVVEAFER